MPDDPFSNLYGEGDYAAAIMVQPLTSDQAADLLPAELELAPQTATPPGTHPVFFMFGRQVNVHSHLSRWPSMTYAEFVLGVPCVQWKATGHTYRGPYFFMPRLFLNRAMPIGLGYLYGFAKELARVESVNEAYQINSLWHNQPLVADRFRRTGQPGLVSDFPLFQTQLEWLNQPFIGKTLLGFCRCSYFDWDFNHAQLQAIEAEVTVAQPFMPGLPPGTFALKGLDHSPLGACWLSTHWRLSPPQACK
jgi:hypothetical protein